MPPESEDESFLKTLTLLHVEDDPAARAEMGVFLGRRAGTLLTARDGTEGLAAFRATPAHIVITDIRMPSMDGLAMAQAIRALDPGVPIIVTTAFEDTDYLMRSVAFGIDQFVVKPIRTNRLEFALLACAHRLRARSAQLRAGPPLDAGERQRLGLLTPREQEVLACIGRGQPSREIGLGLGISHKTVQTHQAHLMIKLGLHKATALAAFAVRAGLA
jgi:DNA-binding NarL/FixJ family response regulator